MNGEGSKLSKGTAAATGLGRIPEHGGMQIATWLHVFIIKMLLYPDNSAAPILYKYSAAVI